MRYNQALLQANEVRKLERKIYTELQRVMIRIKNRASRERENFSITPAEVAKLHETVRDAMVAAHLLGQRRVRLNLVQLSLQDVLKSLGKFDQSNIDALIALYDAKTASVIADLTTRVNSSVQEAVADAISGELNIKSSVAQVSSALSKAGVTVGNSYYVENLVRTQSQLAYGAARWQEYQQPEFDEILWGFEYVTVGDDRVRESHRKLDGVKLPKDDPFWATFFPPNGWSCRCQAIPLFEKEKIKRAPKSAQPDEGFAFNPGDLLVGIAN